MKQITQYHPRRIAVSGLIFVLLTACGGGSTGGGSASPVFVNGSPSTHGIFDPSLTENGAELWMSYSVVNDSVNDPALLTVNTRFATSIDAGQTWTDAGIAPNASEDVLISPGFPIPDYWATWRQEVSRLVYDPHDTDDNRRWKLMWHRYLAAHLPGTTEATRLFEHGWISYATASTPNGPWTERKLFVGSGYNTDNNATIGAPEYNLSTLDAALNGCQAFTEPGLLVKSAAVPSGSNVYVSLHCAGPTHKIVLLRCSGSFAPGNCAYLGDLLTASEAQQYAEQSESYDGFSASELVSADGLDFLIVSPTNNDNYLGCLVFEIADLDTATLVSDSGVPVLVNQIAGYSVYGFHGACGYTPGARATGIIWGQADPSHSPVFNLYSSGIHLP